jgi:hypothetical protein
MWNVTIATKRDIRKLIAGRKAEGKKVKDLDRETGKERVLTQGMEAKKQKRDRLMSLRMKMEYG